MRENATENITDSFIRLQCVDNDVCLEMVISVALHEIAKTYFTQTQLEMSWYLASWNHAAHAGGLFAFVTATAINTGKTVVALECYLSLWSLISWLYNTAFVI